MFCLNFFSPGAKSAFCIPELDWEVLWYQTFAGHERVYKLWLVSFLRFAQAMGRYIIAWQLFILTVLSYSNTK